MVAFVPCCRMLVVGVLSVILCKKKLQLLVFGSRSSSLLVHLPQVLDMYMRVYVAYIYTHTNEYTYMGVVIDINLQCLYLFAWY